jgi:hypothetical protein
MTDGKDDPTKAPGFQKVVQTFLHTKPTPHKAPKKAKPKKAAQKAKAKAGR